MEREPRRPFCADVSAQTAEPLAATASRVDHWILIEYRGLWSRDVLRGSLLSERVKDHLREQLDALPRARLLFIRRPEHRGRPGRRVYVARSTEEGPSLYGFEIEDHDDLLHVDLAAAAAGNGVAAEPEQRLLVVCTHGKRDRCCARYGRPLYERLREAAADDSIWQTTHVGGDRFAGNLVSLPHGLYFGRVGADDVWPLLDEYLAGRIYLSRYRGRSCYPFPVQAAEHAVRESTGFGEFDALRLVSSRRENARLWLVRFLVRAAGEVHEVAVKEEAGELTYLTCEAAALGHPRRFVAVSRRIVSRRRPEGSPPARGA